jgi:AcrR family transcriptional regulator
VGGESVRGHARERLLSVGADLFLERGIHAVSVDALADEARVTKRTVYQHFPGKDALVAQALQQRGEAWRAWFDAELDRRGATPEQQLLAMFDVVADEIRAGGYRGCRFVNAAAELPDRAHPARAVASSHKAAVLALIARRVSRLGISPPDALARQLKVLLEGAIATALVDPDPQAARDARLAAAALLAHASGQPNASGQPRAAASPPGAARGREHQDHDEGSGHARIH